MDPLKYIVPGRKRLPYGMMNFADIRQDNYYYVDKTRFIPMIEEADRFFFFIRPRRFGKSLTLNLLRQYYDVRTRDKFEALFGDLYIGQHPTPSRNSYLVLHLNFSGIGGESKKGILIKGATYLETLAGLDTVVFDKTGTLTKGTFSVTGVHPAKGVTKDELLDVAAHAEAVSDHPIAISNKEALGRAEDMNRVSDASPAAGHGVQAKLDGQQVYAGNARRM